MNARDELAEVVSQALADVTGIFDTSTEEDKGMADHILAAGYSKPRTITTAEELDALGYGAVFRDDNGRLWEVEGIGYGGVDKALNAMSIGARIAFTSFGDFPATVLHEGVTA